ncbi:MAG: glycosyltransferase family 39 protein [Opitutaceae bacterium]|nr:glycosyltransferase family 39 protein [Opitutaceae bacterium]MBP9913731.1 glycosyltransferase family 39 protein [Opitutaceae bacterium]
MSFFRELMRDRKLQLALLTAVLAVLLGFWAIPTQTGLQLVIYGGYWMMLLTTALFVWALWRGLKGGITAAWQEPKNRWPWGVVAGCGLVLIIHEAYGFKVLMDEVMLLGTSMTMHLEKKALVPMRAHDIIGYFQLLDGQLDKRPLFFPFLVSLLHDGIGYRPENPWILNTGLTFVFLGLVYLLGQKLSNRRSGGIVAVLLLTGLPLLAQNATGAGFELLNLTMLAAAIWLGIRWLEQRNHDTLTAFCLAGVLLAQVRYESVVFLLPVALLILWGWWLERRVVLSWPVVAVPLLLLMYPLQHRVFSVRDSSWELASRSEYTQVFSPDYIIANFGHALSFLFDTSGNASNSLVLSALGVLALPFLALWTLRVLRKPQDQPAAAVTLAVFATGFAIWLGIMMCYFWGQFDDPVIRRLSLPLHLLMALAVVVVITQFDRAGRAWRWLVGALVVALAACSIPAMARHAYTMTYHPGLEVAWRREFIAAHPDRDYLVIDNDAIIWITHEVSSTPILQALNRKEVIEFNLRNHSFTDIYVFQRFDIDADTGRAIVHKDDDLGAAYTLETVQERRFSPLMLSRISRVLAVSLAAAPSLPEPVPMEKLSTAEREKARQEYFDNFIKNLP